MSARVICKQGLPWLVLLLIFPLVAQAQHPQRIDAGAFHTCAILDDGTVRCWGRGSNGQLGYGNPLDIGDNETPASAGAVNLGAGRTAKYISAGLYHTCAIRDDDALMCWGRNADGQLGYGNNTGSHLYIGDDETPDAVGTVNLGVGRTAKQVSAGYYHTCAILDDDTVRCWGNNSEGKLGYGNTATHPKIGDDETPDGFGPVNLGAGRTAKRITAGGHHTCAILDDDTVRCWGWNGLGHLGYGNTGTHPFIGDDETPEGFGPVNLGAGRTAKDITSGDNFVCAILDDDTVRCWGQNTSGQLGYGNSGAHAAIGDDETPDGFGPVNLGAGRTAKHISGGDLHACVILDDDSVRCWGINGNGRLGYGNTAAHPKIGDDETPDGFGPVNLGAGRTAAHITAGAWHTCAALDDTNVRCWGDSGDGQLGYNNTDDIGDDETPDTAGPVVLGGTITCVGDGVADPCTDFNVLNTVIQDLVATPTGDLYAASYGFGILASQDNGATWRCVNTDLTNYWAFAIARDNENQLFIGTWADGLGGVWRASANGTNTIWTNVGLGRAQILDIAVSPHDDEVIYAAGQSAEPGATPGAIWVSYDDGDSWDILSDFPASVWSVFVDPDDADVLYAGMFGSGIYKSEDGGANWDLIGSQTNGMSNGYGFSLLRQPNGSTYHHLLAGTADGVWEYNEGTETWSKFGAGLDVIQVRALLGIGSDLYAGTWGRGVFKYDALNDEWDPVIQDLPIQVTSMAWVFPPAAFNPSGSASTTAYRLALGTNGGGITTIDVAGATDVAAAASLPGGYVLHQSYPNPFNPQARIGFELPVSGAVRLEVFDGLGRLVRTLVDGVQPAGTHEVAFEAGSLPSGLYVYRLTTARGTMMGSMLLVK